MDAEAFSKLFLAALIVTLCFGMIGGIVISSIIIQPAWRKSARSWRNETMIQKKISGELSQSLWEAEQLITKYRAEKAVAIDVLAPIVLENESLKNKLREHSANASHS